MERFDYEPLPDVLALDEYRTTVLATYGSRDNWPTDVLDEENRLFNRAMQALSNRIDRPLALPADQPFPPDYTEDQWARDNGITTDQPEDR